MSAYLQQYYKLKVLVELNFKTIFKTMFEVVTKVVIKSRIESNFRLIIEVNFQVCHFLHDALMKEIYSNVHAFLCHFP